MLLAEHGDRSLAAFVHVREGPALRPSGVAGVHGDSSSLELFARPVAQLVVGERSEEEARAGEVGKLNGRDGTSARGLLPALERGHDLPRLGRVVDPRKLHPLDVSDDRDLHDLTS